MSSDLGSHAGWSDEDDDEGGVDPESRSLSDEPRYEWRDQVGKGGMGAVYAVFDTQLGREVALKQAHEGKGDGLALARLEREARITARLEHPGIIPLYDGGRHVDGRRFFTMRLVRGRTFESAIRSEPRERATHLRALRAVCDAVAYAHDQQIVHRDLKLTNIMLGEFGEVYVLDWGLAFDQRSPDEHPRGGGTPGFMSPEQERGERPTVQDDVHAIGRMLECIVEGCTDRLEPAAPGPLRTIVQQATAPASARYATVRALAEELDNYLDGRRVEAHAYTPRELFDAVRTRYGGRLLLGALVLLGVAAMAWRTVSTERREGARARQAEQRVAQALRSESETLGRALAARAVAALSAGDTMEAERSAVEALVRTESADARGVLASTSLQPQPEGVEVDTWADCARPVFGLEGAPLCVFEGYARTRSGTRYEGISTKITHTGSDVLMQVAGRVVIFDAQGQERERLEATHGEAATITRFLYDDEWVGARVDHEVWLVARQGEERRQFRPCGDAVVHAVAMSKGVVVAACGDDSLRARNLRTDETYERAVPFGLDAPAFAIGTDGQRAVLGGVDGRVVEVSIDSEVPPLLLLSLHSPIREVDVDGTRAVVVQEAGPARILDLDSGHETMRIPAGSSRWAALSGDTLVLAGGTTRSRWQLGSAQREADVSHFAEGISRVAVRDDRIAVARGDATISILRPGRPPRHLSAGTQVVKSVAFSSDGRYLAAALADVAGVAVFDTQGWQPLPEISARRGTRRVAFARDGSLIAAHYGRGLLAWASWTEPATEMELEATILDLVSASDDLPMLALARGGDLYEREPGGGLIRIDGLVGAIAAARSTRGDIALASTTDVRVLRGDGTARSWRMPGEIEDIAFGPEGELVLVGTRAGVIHVVNASSGTTLAVLRGFRSRVSWVGVHEDQLLGASWDGTLRRFALAPILEAPERLQAEAESRWAGLQGERADME